MSVLATLKKLIGIGGGYPSTDPNQRGQFDGQSIAIGTHNEVLEPSLDAILGHCRHFERSMPKARAIVEGFRADTVGTGIAIEPQTGDRLMDGRLRAAFETWAKSAGINGESLWELQHLAAGEICTSGAALWRWIDDPNARGIKLRLVALEVEWFATEPLTAIPADHTFVRGIQLDALARPVTYHLLHPETGTPEVVDAADIIHAFLPRRARQAHGEPELASLILRLMQDDRLVLTELRAALNTAAVSGIITTEDADIILGAATAPANPNGAPIATTRRRLEAGTVLTLRPGETWETVENKRPAQGIKEFRGTINGDLAAGSGLSQQWLDRDSSRANYSSMREDNLRTERRLGPIRAMIGRHLAGRVYERLLPLLTIQAGLGRVKPDYELRPDRPPYVDPLKDAEALVYQVANNLLTLEEALAGQGRDFETVVTKRAAENKRLAELGLPVPMPGPIQLSATAQETAP